MREMGWQPAGCCILAMAVEEEVTEGTTFGKQERLRVHERERGLLGRCHVLTDSGDTGKEDYFAVF